MVVTPDGKLYYNLAENLVNGKGLINTVREEDIIVPPLFSLILAPFVLMFNRDRKSTRLNSSHH